MCTWLMNAKTQAETVIKEINNNNNGFINVSFVQVFKKIIKIKLVANCYTNNNLYNYICQLKLLLCLLKALTDPANLMAVCS